VTTRRKIFLKAHRKRRKWTELNQWRRFLLNSGRRHGERVEREPITRSGGRAPSGVQGQRPWSGIRGAKPLWSWKKI